MKVICSRCKKLGNFKTNPCGRCQTKLRERQLNKSPNRYGRIVRDGVMFNA